MWATLNTAWDTHPVIQAFLINFLSASSILVVGWVLSGLLGRSIRRLASRSPHLDPTIIPMLQSGAVWAFRIFVIIAVLARFGVQTASLIAALSAAGLAIGLALQGTLQNIAAGIMLLVLRPLRVGEHVSVVGRAEGVVEEVGLFMSRLRQGDGIIVHMPNSLVWGNTIINYSRSQLRRLEFVVQIPRADDLEVVIPALQKSVDQHPDVLDNPVPQVLVTASMETFTSVTIQAWTEASRHGSARTDLYRKALATVKRLRDDKSAV